MEPDILLRTPFAIDECVRREFPDATVQIDGERKALNIVLSQALDLPNGRQVAVSTIISRRILIDVIYEIAQYRLSSDEASQSLITCTPLSGWDEAECMQSNRFRRREFEQKHGSCTNAIVAYLKNPNDQACLSDIRQLGLAPDQVHPQYEEDLRYFRELMDGKLSEICRSSFVTKYENMFQVLREKSLQGEIEKIKAEESRDLSSMTDSIVQILHRRVVGQDMAVEAMASVLLRQQGKKNRTFLFVGPTGVGKTELAQAVGVFKGYGRFVNFDMANYQTEFKVTAFTGSSTGYIGSDDLPDFCKQIDGTGKVERLRTYGSEEQVVVKNIVILFDEIGKAHTTIRSALLSLFDKGTHSVHYTSRGDSFGHSENKTVTYTFENCLFIGTSNLFQDLIVAASIQKKKKQEIVEIFTQASARAVSIGYPAQSGEIPFTPEVLGRMSICPFGPIPKGPNGYQAIVEMKLDSWLDELNKLFHELFQDKCGRVFVESGDRGPFLVRVEAELYGDGTNVRKLGAFFDTLQTKIVSEKGLKLTEKVDLSIYANSNAIYVQRYIVDASYFIHEPYGDPLKIHLFEEVSQ